VDRVKIAALAALFTRFLLAYSVNAQFGQNVAYPDLPGNQVAIAAIVSLRLLMEVKVPQPMDCDGIGLTPDTG